MPKKCTCTNNWSRRNSGFLYDFWVLFSLFLSSVYYSLLCFLFPFLKRTPWDVDFQLAYWCSSFNLTDFVMLNSKMANLVWWNVIVKISPWNNTMWEHFKSTRRPRLIAALSSKTCYQLTILHFCWLLLFQIGISL